jgi:hypothetical protein
MHCEEKLNQSHKLQVKADLTVQIRQTQIWNLENVI